MRQFFKTITKLVALAGIVTAIAYAVKKLFIDKDEDEYADSYTDLDYHLDEDLQPVHDKEYVPIKPEAEKSEKQE